MKKVLIVLAAITLSTTSLAKNFTIPKTYTVRYTHNFGEISGFTQIPKGGQYNTSSEKRPTFDELGIKNMSFPELYIGAKWEKFGIFYNMKYKDFRGSTTLKEDLKTHDIELKKGDRISSKHHYAFYGLGFSYDFNVCQHFTITPKLEFSILDFSYRFSSSGSREIKNDTRSFGAGGVRVGGEAVAKINENFSIRLDAMAHIPHDSIRSSFETSLIGSYNLYRSGTKEINVIGGVGYNRFKYRDTQKEMQNFMKTEIQPIYKVGLELKF